MNLTPKVGPNEIGKTKVFFIMKLSLEDKKEIVRLYFDEHYGFRIIGKKFSIRASNVNKIINGYKIHGETYLIHPPKMHNYSPEFN